MGLTRFISVLHSVFGISSLSPAQPSNRGLAFRMTTFAKTSIPNIPFLASDAPPDLPSAEIVFGHSVLQLLMEAPSKRRIGGIGASEANITG
jgi:hypothetical protein